MSETKDVVIDQLNEEQAGLGQAPKLDHEQTLIICIENLTAAGNALLRRVVILESRAAALELHAQHQDEARRK